MRTAAPTGTATSSCSSPPPRPPPARTTRWRPTSTQKTLLTNDSVGVVGRQQGTNGTLKYYTAGRSAAGAWQIAEVTDTTLTQLATGTVAALTVGQTYRVRLDMTGTTTTTLSLYVNGVQVLTVTDSTAPLTVAGKAGIIDGTGPRAMSPRPPPRVFTSTTSR